MIKLNYDVIIVNYNGEKIISECLKSVYGSDIQPKKIIIYDNHSSDNSVNLIEEKFQNVILIKGKENIGFGKANNIALNHSTSNYILFINNDVILDQKCASELLNAFKESKTVIVNPLIIRGWDTKDDSNIYSYGAIVDDTGFGYSITKLDSTIPNCFSGACFMAKSSILKQLRFEPQFFMYYEETEISTRLLKLGLKINRTPKAKCYHLENYSSPKKHADGIAFRQHMAVQNRWYMIGVNWPLCLLPKAIMVNILHLLYLQFFFFKNKQFNKLNLILKAPEKLILGLYQRNNYLKDKYWYKHLKRTSISTYFFNKKAVFNRKPPN